MIVFLILPGLLTPRMARPRLPLHLMLGMAVAVAAAAAAVVAVIPILAATVTWQGGGVCRTSVKARVMVAATDSAAIVS